MRADFRGAKYEVGSSRTVEVQIQKGDQGKGGGRRGASRCPYAVRWSKFQNGERMPFLVQVATGLPLDAPAFWIVALRRSLGKQPNTLGNDLRSLIPILLWADARGVNISERLREGVFFSLAELLDIADFCGLFIDDAVSEIEDRSSNPVRLDRRKKTDRRRVKLGEKRNRLAAIRSFVEFTSADFLSNLAVWPQRWSHYNAVRSECLKLLQGHIEGLPNRNSDDVGQPEGLGRAAQRRLREVIEPGHPENPFTPDVQFRNYVIVKLLLDTGVRRGELLIVKVSDCSLGSSGLITVHRSPDDPQDDRSDKPATKTAARILALSGRMAELLHEWVVHYRAKIPGANRHPFLIVSSRDGRPMSLSNVNKIMSTLRQVSGLPKDLTPHVLRHTWNDNFSEMADRKGISEEQEIKWRARLMGWRSENSARHYLRRTVRRRSNEFFKKMQDAMTIQTAEVQE